MRKHRFICSFAAFTAMCSASGCAEAAAESIWSEFQTACGSINAQDFDENAKKAGWAIFDPPQNSYFAKQRDYVRAESLKLTNALPSGSVAVTDKIYAKLSDSRQLYLWIAPGTADRGDERYEIITCSVLQPDATEGLSKSAIAQIDKRVPEQFGGDLVEGYRWIPGLGKDQENTVVMFIPLYSRDRLAAAAVEMQGLVLKQQTIRRIEK